MKKIWKDKKIRIAAIILVAVFALTMVSLSVYKRACGIYDIERHIAGVAELMTPSQQDIQYVEENYPKLNAFQKKLVSNYDTYEYIYEVYTDELIDAFKTGEDYVQFYDIVMSRLGKYVNEPYIDVDKENRVVNINLVAGPETENNLMNNPEQASEYFQVVLDDLLYVTKAGCEITSLYGLNLKAVVTTNESDGIKIMEVENGVVTSYILAEN